MRMSHLLPALLHGSRGILFGKDDTAPVGWNALAWVRTADDVPLEAVAEPIRPLPAKEYIARCSAILAAKEGGRAGVAGIAWLDDTERVVDRDLDDGLGARLLLRGAEARSDRVGDGIPVGDDIGAGRCWQSRDRDERERQGASSESARNRSGAAKPWLARRSAPTRVEAGCARIAVTVPIQWLQRPPRAYRPVSCASDRSRPTSRSVSGDPREPAEARVRGPLCDGVAGGGQLRRLTRWEPLPDGEAGRRGGRTAPPPFRPQLGQRFVRPGVRR